MDSLGKLLSCRLALLVSVAVVMASCSDQEKQSQETEEADGGSYLKVTTDPAEIAAVRRLSDDRDQAVLDAFFVKPPAFYETGVRRIYREHQDEIDAHVRELLEDPNGEVSAEMLGLAFRLQIPGAGERFVRRYHATADEDEKRMMLNMIRRATPFEEDQRERFKKYLGEERILVELLLGLLDSDDPRTLKSAVENCGYFGIPGRAEKLIGVLARTEPAVSARVLFWLSKTELSTQQRAVLLNQAPELVKDFSERDIAWAGTLWIQMIEDGSPQERQAAKEILKSWIEASYQEKVTGYGSRMQLIEAASSSADESESAWLRSMVDREPGIYAEIPLRWLIQLQPDEGRKILLQWLADEERRLGGVRVAEQAYASTEDEEVVRALVSSARPTDESYQLMALCSALRAIGGDFANSQANEMSAQVSGASSPYHRQQLDPQSFDESAKEVLASGALTEKEISSARDQLSKTLEEYGWEEGAGVSVETVFLAAERGLSFDVETGMLPCRHDELVRDFASVSGSEFQPEAVYEVWQQKNAEDYDAPYTLQLICGERLYSVELRNFGDWYDVERVVEVINRVLADQGNSRRFVGLAARGQSASFLFSDPTALQKLADGGAIALGADPNESREQGLEFERRAIDALNKQ